MSVVGVDGCRGGWIAVALDDGPSARGFFLAHLDELLDAIPEARAAALDIPIGLLPASRRRADVEARRVLGPRSSSIFDAPVRRAVTAATYAEANSITRELTGHGLSRQSFALCPKIREAERWTRAAPIPAWEVHPEVSFTMLMEHPPAFRKSTWAGLHERLRALQRAGISLDDIGPAGRHAAADDVVDAAVAAWSAARLVCGAGISIPDPPETAPDSDRPMAIWA